VIFHSQVILIPADFEPWLNFIKSAVQMKTCKLCLWTIKRCNNVLNDEHFRMNFAMLQFWCLPISKTFLMLWVLQKLQINLVYIHIACVAGIALFNYNDSYNFYHITITCPLLSLHITTSWELIMFIYFWRYIQPTCATSGQGLYEGLDWLSSHISNKTRWTTLWVRFWSSINAHTPL